MKLGTSWKKVVNNTPVGYPIQLSYPKEKTVWDHKLKLNVVSLEPGYYVLDKFYNGKGYGWKGQGWDYQNKEPLLAGLEAKGGEVIYILN
jgi:hypothetical protein